MAVVLLYVLYVIIYALIQRGDAPPADVETAPRVTVQTVQHTPTFTLSFFDALEHGKGQAAQGLKPPAPAYAYAAAGAIRRLSQTMWQGVRRPTTPVR